MDLHILDLNFLNLPHVIASYLIVGPEGPVLVETGPSTVIETLKMRLAEHGYAPSDVRHILLTHIHLDHAGAAGWWAQQGAHIHVHHVGAPHLVDPSKLINSARRIYGETFDALWGEIRPVPADRITALYDNDTIHVGGLTFTALDTPGHARHHHVFRLGDIAFTGDAAGVRMPSSPLISLPAPPPEFDREAWRVTLDRLVKENFRTIYPTHFGAVEHVRAHLDAFRALMDESVEWIRVKMETGVTRDKMVTQYITWYRQRATALGISEEEINQQAGANPAFMSVDGLMRYWKKMGIE
jgi:glyoxylase-like metal-dependent hydrolase (beta-lactamase superfamily II)